MNRSHRRRWAGWEASIDAMAQRYRRDAVAFIVQAHAKEGVKRGPLDFVGCLDGGRALVADAKTANSGRWPFSSLELHQAQQLEAATDRGAVAGLLIRLGSATTQRAWWVSWAELRDAWWRWKDHGGRPASWTPDDCGTPIPFTEDGLPDFLEALGEAA